MIKRNLVLLLVASANVVYGQRGASVMMTSMIEVADRLTLKGQWKEAVAIRHQLLLQNPSPNIQVTLLIKTGVDLRYSERYQEAQRLFEKGLEIAEKKGLKSERADALYQLGEIVYVKWAYFRTDSVDRARELISDALEIYEGTNDFVGISQCLYRLGTILQINSDGPGSRSAFRRSILASEKVQDTLGLTRSFTHLGADHSDRGMMDSALYFYQQALALADAQGNNYGRAHYLNNVGEILLLMNRKEEALETFMRALFISQELKQNLILCRSYYSLGDFYKKEGDLKKSKKYLTEGLACARSIGYRNFVDGFEEALGR